jgi:Carboxypeptidase regulatory-like domain
MTKSKRKLLFIIAIPLWASIVFAALQGSAAAQSFYGAIVGSVTDSSGAIVPGARVILTDVGTNEKHETAADSSGTYRFVNLVPANYRLEVDKEGFKHFTREKIAVAVGGDTRIDVAMQVGAATETVEVSSQTPHCRLGSVAVEGHQDQREPECAVPRRVLQRL